MTGPDLAELNRAKIAARDEWEKLEAEANAIRARLTEAQRRARRALREFERARLAYVDAADRAGGQG